MSLRDAYEAMVQALPGYLPQGFPVVTCRFGADALGQQDAAPRIVWVPTTDRFDGAAKGGANPRDLYSVPTGADLHIWGADAEQRGAEYDYDAAMLLRDAVLNALHAQVRGVGGAITGGVSVPADGAVTRSGWLYVLSITVGIPVVRLPVPTATPGGVTFPLQGH